MSQINYTSLQALEKRLPLTLATRQSPLAQAQSRQVGELVAEYLKSQSNNEYNTHFELETFLTEGDQRLSGALAEIGGKGLFVKEVEQALLDKRADFAVHSMKDMPAKMIDGLVIAAIPPREAPQDAFLSDIADHPSQLPHNATVGSSSVRRAAQILALRPDLKIVPFRGNIDRRLEKLSQGEVDATFLAEAGLQRGSKHHVKRVILGTKEWLPSLAQGALCVQCRADDKDLIAILQQISCPTTEIEIAAERAFLQKLDGSCRTPIAGIAQYHDQQLTLTVAVYELDGSITYQDTANINISKKYTHQDIINQATMMGYGLADQLFAQIPDHSALRHILNPLRT